MKTFDYVIKDPIGIHSRPAGDVVKKAKEFNSEIVIKKGDKTASAKQLFALMKLGVKCGDSISVAVNGEDEEKAMAEMQALLEEKF
jgi:phosphocarrier protein